jgi:hypothetical protein
MIMSTFDQKPGPLDSFPEPISGPTPSVFSIPETIPPPGPVIDVPPVEVFPHQPSEPLEGPDEGGEEFPRVPSDQDFLRPRDPEELQEPLVEGGDSGTGEVTLAQGQASDGLDAGSDTADADTSGGDSGDGGGDANDGGDPQ